MTELASHENVHVKLAALLVKGSQTSGGTNAPLASEERPPRGACSFRGLHRTVWRSPLQVREHFSGAKALVQSSRTSGMRADVSLLTASADKQSEILGYSPDCIDFMVG